MYGSNNPLRFVDDDGLGAKEFVFGVMNAVSSNGGVTQRVRGSHADVRLGQRLGDGLSIVGGFVEMAGGTAMTGAGAGACGTAVLCVAGAPAIVAGAAVAGHGAMMTGNALTSFMKASDDAPEASGGSSPEKLPELITNPKHHPNSASPQPSNVNDLFTNSVVVKNVSGGRRTWTGRSIDSVRRVTAKRTGMAPRLAKG